LNALDNFHSSQLKASLIFYKFDSSRSVVLYQYSTLVVRQ